MKQEDKIKFLIPYVEENFITFPLMEEGIYSVFLNMWLVFDDLNESKMLSIINKDFNTDKVCVDFEVSKYPNLDPDYFVIENNEFKLKYSETEFSNKVLINIYYKDYDSTNINKLLDVAVNIITYKNSIGNIKRHYVK